eukprot:TRINITY_DN7649_c1_g1_i1.p2 TRINITY_DN7649_c1_g1~~TRINITY_DN7649_c1_g1_i1.p2  ORF type:complete len:186 (+),score=13.55 TRINITY_DN7649_c1_g1_i1:1218-1775(+)
MDHQTCELHRLSCANAHHLAFYPLALLELDTCRCRVFWTDLDFLGHMNNARYPRSADFARYQLWKLNGVFKALDKLGGFMVLGAHTIRFRRSLEPFEAFDIQSKVLGWDETNFYVEQRFVTQDGFVKAIMYARQSMVKATTAQVLETIGHTTPSPSLPRHVQHWLQFVEEDSALLRKEAGLVKVD